MVEIRIKPLIGAALLAMLIIGAPMARAAEIADVRLAAAESVGATGISFQLATAFEELVLTVSGPGYHRIDVLGYSASPSFDLSDGDGAPLADGIYNFELRIMPQPPAELVSAVERARANRDEALYDQLSDQLQNWGADLQPLIHSGSFRLTGGVLERLYDRDLAPAEKEVAE